MIGAADLARISCALFLMIGLLTGIWKYRKIKTSPTASAPIYVDICHRASLMYAFACLALAEFAQSSAWSMTVNRLAVAGPVFFFAAAVSSYAVHGLLADTDNQLARPHQLGRRQLNPKLMAAFIYLLAAVEVGGASVLIAGYLRSLWSGPAGLGA